ncbi:MAG TPA: polymer-forming cytoskeletal protein [Anaerolineae bacterium]|nr:polymer-forming cytoskeletal protein [Anaerolineae bacterium]
MFGREKRPVPLDRVEVTVGPTANINGDLVCDGIVKIDGVYGGSIKTVSNVIISEKGRVDADIEAQNVSVSGQAKGSIVAKGRLEILSTGRVWADVTVTSFLLDDGGKLHGALRMFGTEPAPESFDVPPTPRDQSQAEDTPTEEPVPAEDD